MAEEKVLFIVRHGKSGWDYNGIEDIDRPLIERGIRDAHTMAEKLVKRGLLPDCIISSPAIRAAHTAIIFSRITGFPEKDIKLEEDLYLAETKEILKIVTKIDNSLTKAMILGHNPGFTDLVNYLSGLRLDNLPTAGLVMLKFKTDSWKEVSKKNLISEFFDSPHSI